jgi:mono/diheme cytochrome c family protein
MRRMTCPLLVICLGMLVPGGAGTPVWAAPATAHPVVPGFERFYSGQKTDAARGGQLLLGELGCVNCHKGTEQTFAPRQGPVLSKVASRVRVSHLRKFLRDPHSVKPGTPMPDLLGSDPERDSKVEALVQFLASTGALKQERPDFKGINNGRDLYGKVGCVVCHGTRDARGNPDRVLSTSVPLGDLKAKYSISSLAAFLENPHQVRPAGRMPKLLAGKEAKEVANYLLQGIKIDLSGKGASKFAYYEGNWQKLPDFKKLRPKVTGTIPGFDLGAARRNSNYALRFEGFFKVEQDSNYTFTLSSDDGAQIFVDDKLVADTDGIHPTTTKKGSVKLTKGVHRVAVTFFQGGGEAVLDVRVEAPGFGHHNLADLVAPSEAALEKKPVAKKKDEDFIEIQPTLVARGRELFASMGCASCHRADVGGKPIDSRLAAPALGKLKPEGGCLAQRPSGNLPRYDLSARQRGALAAAIKSPPAVDKNPASVIARTMTAFNCYACHSRDKVGGPQEELNKFFQTTQPEMGDEARIPPPLDGVGAKMAPSYLLHLLDQGVHDRPYMHTRMPGFGNNNVGHLIAAFTAIDKPIKVPAVTFDIPANRIKSTARTLVSGNSLGCVKCHTFAGQKAEGVQGIDMALMTRRLQHDWFRAYVANPSQFRPGTRMPSAYVDGKSVLPKVLDGTASTQVEAMWLYLQDGSKARLPIGMRGKSIPLVPEGGAIVYRNFIEGAGSRGIAVGYPEKVSVAFDANGLRLALLWQGAFIDAGRHWNDRGAGFEGPLGDNILHLPAGVPFATLSQPTEAWPGGQAKEKGYRFRGYRLTPDDRPTFLYSYGDLRFEDFPNAAGGKPPGVKRRITVTSAKPPGNLYYRAAVANKIEPLPDGSFRIDGAWKLKAEGGTPQSRQSGGKTELLVPVNFKDGKGEIVLQYVW